MQAKIVPILQEGHERQLSLPLFFTGKAPVIPFPVSNDSMPNTFEWTAEEISLLRERVLMDSLRSLTDGRATAVKTEVMSWMMSDESLPFSFRTCANDIGMDHIEIRVRVLRIIALLERKLLSE